MPEILENRDQWLDAFNQGWLAEFQQTGNTNFKIYPRLHNTPLAPSSGVALETSRLLLISSGGFSLPTQHPFDAANKLGDYSVRELPTDVDPASLVISHDHYDHSLVEEDPGVLLPTSVLKEMEAAGEIGELIPTFVGFMGYQPDVTRVADETAAAVVAIAKRLRAEAAFLVPS